MSALETSAASRVRRGPMLTVLLTGQAMATMDGSIVSVSAHTIREQLGAGDTTIQLIVSGYLLTTGVLLVTCARLGDIVGHRRMFLIGLGCFTAASLLCGVAPSDWTLVLSRIAQGAGAAMLMPQVFSLIQLHWDGAARRRAIGLYSMVLALGVALGQILGGLVVTADVAGLSWRAAFLINVPVGVTLLTLGRRWLSAGAQTARPRLDLVGVAVLALAMITITGPLVFGPDYGWPAGTWAIVAFGCALLAIFVRHEALAKQPLLDPSAVRPPGVKAGLATCWIVMGCYTAFVLTLTLHLQSSLGFTPLEAGLAFVPYALGFATLSLTWTSYPEQVRRVLPVAGPMVFATVAVTVAATSGTHWHVLWATPLLFLAGAGHAAGYGPTIARITTLVDAQHVSAVSALNATGPLLASVTAVAGVGSLYFAAPTSGAGLVQVACVLLGLLVVAAGCALRVAVLNTRTDQ